MDKKSIIRGIGEITLQRQPLWRRDFLSICLSSLFLFITYYALVATLPVYVMEVLNGGDREALVCL
ncbi:hypothetical protein BRIN106911_20385 [Brevibacillus invocatus]